MNNMKSNSLNKRPGKEAFIQFKVVSKGLYFDFYYGTKEDK